MSYKGYTISRTLTGDIFITRGGVHISYARSFDDAKTIIDNLVS